MTISLQYFWVTIFFLLGTIANWTEVSAQNGYIYVHKKASGEESAGNFSFSVTGGPTTVPNFTLNDRSDTIRIVDIGVSQTGRIYAAASTTSPLGAGRIYYRNAGSSQWVSTNITGATRIDGGSGNTAYYLDAAGNGYAFDGISTATQIYTSNSVTGNVGIDIGASWEDSVYIVTQGA
ncbi:MAG TPA: hypothetical protein PKD90_07140 [Phnomibacter sp.]|nr:hypothetical protein [Phnomibacter sp.]